MQPLLYLSARTIISYLQALERHERAFVSTVPMCLATGAAHCWAVVYALMIAVLMQVVRLHGPQPDYTDRIPSWIFSTERLSSAMMLLWCIAGSAVCYIRIIQVDEHMQGLPLDSRDTGCPKLMQAIQSPIVRKLVQVVYMLSGAGLFLSILLLCLAMVLVGGSVTSSDVCLVFVAFGFALPHAVVAVCRIVGSSSSWASSLLSMAAEAAAVGPQLCVILSTADVAGVMPLWQKLLNGATTAAFLLSLAASAASPARREGASVAPDPGTLAVCLLLDLAAMAMLVTVFATLRDYFWWALVALKVIIAAAISFRLVREPLVEIMEPIMPLQSSAEKRPPSRLREIARLPLHVLALLSAIAAVYGVAFSSGRAAGSQQAYGTVDTNWQHEYHGDYPEDEHEHWSQSDYHDDYEDLDYGWNTPWLMLRWQQELEDFGPDALLSAVSRSLDMGHEDLLSEEVLTPHRVLLFRFLNPVTFNESAARQRQWHEAVTGAHEALSGIADLTFPAQLDQHLCQRLAWGENVTLPVPGNDSDGSNTSGGAIGSTVPSEEFEEAGAGGLSESADALAAYTAACDVWDRHVGNTHEHYSDDWRDYHDYDPDEVDHDYADEETGDESDAEGRELDM